MGGGGGGGADAEPYMHSDGPSYRTFWEEFWRFWRRRSIENYIDHIGSSTYIYIYT